MFICGSTQKAMLMHGHRTINISWHKINAWQEAIIKNFRIAFMWIVAFILRANETCIMHTDASFVNTLLWGSFLVNKYDLSVCVPPCARRIRKRMHERVCVLIAKQTNTYSDMLLFVLGNGRQSIQPPAILQNSICWTVNLQQYIIAKWERSHANACGGHSWMTLAHCTYVLCDYIFSNECVCSVCMEELDSRSLFSPSSSPTSHFVSSCGIPVFRELFTL